MKRCCLIGILMLAPPVPAIALTPLPDFKLDGYVATWYEIASIRGFLQSRCARDTRTEYSIGENAALLLESTCLRTDGTPERSEARARWYPFGRESIVVARGPDRRWLAVGHPSLRYARILGHTPALSDDDLKSAAAALAEAQFDLCAMVLTVQTDGRQQSARLCDIVRPMTLPPAPMPGTLQ